MARDKTLIFILLLCTLIVGVLLIPAQRGTAQRTLLFSEYFTQDTIDKTKWDYPAPMQYTINNEGLTFKEDYQVPSILTMKQSYMDDIITFSMDYYNCGENELSTSFYIRSTSTTLTNASDMYNYIGIEFNGYNGGDIILTYVTKSYVIQNTDIGINWKNDTWYRINIDMNYVDNNFEITLYESNGLTLTKTYTEIWRNTYSNWYSLQRPVYFGIIVNEFVLSGKNGPAINEAGAYFRDTFKIDNIEFWSNESTGLDLSLNLLYILAISTILIIYGSVINANCQWHHAMATCIGVLGLCMVSALIINVWLYATWALVTLLISLWCMIILIVRETWEMSYDGYETVGNITLIVGILFTIITYVEYITLWLTKYYRPLWW